MPNDQKVEEIKYLQKLIEDSVSVVTTTFTGMSVSEMTDFRKHLRDNGLKYRVVKNRLLYRATADLDKSYINDIVEGQTGVIFSNNDPIDPHRAVDTFFAKNPSVSLKVLGGTLGAEVLSSEQVLAIAKLPSKEQLIAKLMATLNGPITSFVRVLNAPSEALARLLNRIVEQKSEEKQEG
jgi:large subunit ribosomal protein L10